VTYWRVVLNRVFGRNSEDSEMADELRFHLDARAEDLQNRGLSSDDAFRQARLEFGSVESYMEDCRDARGLRAVDLLRSDFRYSIRTLIKSRGFSLIAILSLALSIGVNLSCFASFYAMVVRPFSYPDLPRIVTLDESREKTTDRSAVAPANYLDWKSRSHVFDSLAAFRVWDANLGGVDHPDHVRVASATPDLFQVVSLNPTRGRIFSPAEAQAGADSVAVISKGFWHSRLGDSKDPIGQTIKLNGRVLTIVGVMPNEFNLPLEAELWTPLVFTDGEKADRRDETLGVVGKLRASSSIQTAAADMDRIAHELQKEYPDTNAHARISVMSLLDATTSDNRRFLLVLQCSALFVLLLGAVNVGSLQVARALSRQKEIALRRALGASAGRIWCQLLTENLLLAALGAAAAVALSSWHLAVMRASIPESVYALAPGLREMRIEGHVIAFGCLLALISGVLCSLPGMLELMRANRGTDLSVSLKEGGRVIGGSWKRRQLRTFLVAGEVTLAFTLLVGAGLMVGTFRKIATSNLGFDKENLLGARLSLTGAEYSNSARLVSFYDGVLRTLNTSSATDSAALSSESEPVSTVATGDGGQAHSEELRPRVLSTSSRYLRAMRMPLVSGRWINDTDDSHSAPAVVLSASLAREYWPHADAVGKRLRLGGPDTPWLLVVGTAGDTNDWFLQRPEPTAYLSYRQFPKTSTRFLLRGRGDSRKLTGALREAVARLSTDQSIYDVVTVARELQEETTGIRNAASMMGTYATIALLLAVTGIYSVTTFFVMQRKPDIAIRMSLGASRKAILGMVVGQSFRTTLLGLAAGVPIAALLTLGMSRALFGLVPVQPLAFLSFLALMLVAALAAGYLPAWRASRVDPVQVLRQD
jgi:predicted permease